mmetsp:Transcript_24855/g.46415  ORF Transcript_24855/g.46415 Transcript_24855/m.46415 type:complete len:211 (-) Transcript_24855:384-1016(-)
MSVHIPMLSLSNLEFKKSGHDVLERLVKTNLRTCSSHVKSTVGSFRIDNRSYTFTFLQKISHDEVSPSPTKHSLFFAREHPRELVFKVERRIGVISEQGSHSVQDTKSVFLVQSSHTSSSAKEDGKGLKLIALFSQNRFCKIQERVEIVGDSFLQFLVILNGGKTSNARAKTVAPSTSRIGKTQFPPCDSVLHILTIRQHSRFPFKHVNT